MHDQVGALHEAGVNAAFLNSALDAEEARQVERELMSGRLTLLYAAPERILTPRCLAMLLRCTSAACSACLPSTKRTASASGATTSARSTWA
jgi:superfamily II DNA helicase RecQ